MLAYRLVAPNASERAHLLADAGHDYMAYLPVVLALSTVVVLLGLVGQARTAARSGTAPGLAAWQFALIAPLLFCCQEHFERLLHDGSFPADAVFQRTFVLGLVLQIPFAISAYILARVLLRAAQAVGRLLGAAPRERRVVPILPSLRSSVDAPRRPALSRGFGTRGPPRFFAA